MALRPERQYPFQYKYFPYYSQYVVQFLEFTSNDGVLRFARARTAKTIRGSLYKWKCFFVDLDCSQGFGTFHFGKGTIVGSGWEENGKTCDSNRCEELLEK